MSDLQGVVYKDKKQPSHLMQGWDGHQAAHWVSEVYYLGMVLKIQVQAYVYV